MAVKYDSEVIYEYAWKLYIQASGLKYIWGFVGFCGGGAVAALAFHASEAAALFLAAVGAILGAMYGERRSFQLRLTAQSALCSVAIEQNTRQQPRME